MIISFKTLGCRLNQAEEEKLRRQFLEAGYLISNPKNADVCIVNTCSVTALADKKSIQVIKKLKIDNCKMKIVVIGCGAEKAKDLPVVDLVILNEDKDRVLEIIDCHFDQTKCVEKSKSGSWTALGITAPRKNLNSFGDSRLNIRDSSKRTRAFLKVQDGCNNFCAYCIVPYLRGREKSVNKRAVIKEVKKLEKMGYKELVLTGVNIGRYSGGPTFPSSVIWSKVEKSDAGLQGSVPSKGQSLVDMLRILLKETKFPRIRLSSINPQDITDDMIDLWVAEPRLCRHFHLSLQSGSNTVLARMGRPYTAQKHSSLVNKITQVMPEVAITTDVIVGFPGETNNEFEETHNLIKGLNLAKIHVFRYSKREGTKASEMPNQVPENVKKERAKKLQKLSDKKNKEFIQRFIGHEMDVLFERHQTCRCGTLTGGRVTPKTKLWPGLTSNYIHVKVCSEGDLRGKIQRIKLSKDNTHERK